MIQGAADGSKNTVQREYKKNNQTTNSNKNYKLPYSKTYLTYYDP
jgi:hypothetical protein